MSIDYEIITITIPDIKDEVWKVVKETEGRLFISNMGRVKRYREFRDKFRPKNHKNVYALASIQKHRNYLIYSIKINRKQIVKSVHLTVAEYFIDNPNGYDKVIHKDGNLTNNKFDNLLWASDIEMYLHAIKIKPKDYKHTPSIPLSDLEYRRDESAAQNIPRSEYLNIHKWIKKYYGKANKCSSDTCDNSSNIFDWALIHGRLYKRDVNNFIMLCRKCHCKYDARPLDEIVKKKVSDGNSQRGKRGFDSGRTSPTLIEKDDFSFIGTVRDCAKILGTNENYLSRIINKGKTYKGYSIRKALHNER